MKRLKVDQERHGQYATKARALKARKSRTLKHAAVKTVTYRDLKPLSCWTLVLK